jgi:hypothetical protein
VEAVFGWGGCVSSLTFLFFFFCFFLLCVLSAGMALEVLFR